FGSALGRLRQLHHDEQSASRLLQACLEKEAEATKREPQNSGSWYRLAAIESSLGKIDAAIDHLRAAIRAGWIDTRSLRLDPRFDAIVGESRFHEIISALATKIAELRRQTGQPIEMASTDEDNSP